MLWQKRIKELQDLNEKQKDTKIKKRVGALLIMLDSFREAIRNPLMHPEMSLDQDCATSIFKLVTSLITSVTKEIIHHEERQSTADAELTKDNKEQKTEGKES